MTIPAPPRIL
ncbi:MAG: phosphomethylpyrimidine kinase, partial [Porphyrobacter sp. HL-46]